MKQKYEHKFLYIILIYIVKLTYNNGYIFFSFIVEKNLVFPTQFFR